MAISKEFVICLSCLATLALGWGARAAMDHMRVEQVQHDEKIRQVAFLKAREQALAELKAIAAQREADARTAAAGVSPGAGNNGAPPGPSAPEDAEMKDFVAHARISSVLLGNPRIVVINKKEYEEGGEVVLPSGRRAKITEIREDGVTLNRAGRAYILASR